MDVDDAVNVPGVAPLHLCHRVHMHLCHRVHMHLCHRVHMLEQPH